MSTLEIAAKVQALVKSCGGTMLDSAQACRASNFTALQCIPQIYLLFPTSTASDVACVAVQVWGASLSTSELTKVLQSCKKTDGSRAYSDADISAAGTANISLKYLDVMHVPTQYGGAANMQLKMIGLSQGNLTTLKEAECARLLVISCLPGDYSPSPGTLIAALKSAYGLNIATMAKDPAADYRSTHHCWISKDLSTYTTKAVPYQQILCLESTGSAAPANIPGIFAAIKAYMPNPPAIPDTGATIVSAMVSTGDARADKTAVLTALFDGCWGLMNDGADPGYNLTNFRVVVYNTAWEQPMTTLFDQLKQKHA